ncbi:MAG: LysM peptidoglycan-binding domain-containing protein [Gemmatimonadetes bacterium]|nr:MAG: LysM peptidoglycan-binding domain-containing protein [Gemmatimonadota bacterium]
MKTLIKFSLLAIIAVALSSCASSQVNKTCDELETLMDSQEGQLKAAEWQAYAGCVDEDLASLQGELDQLNQQKADLEKQKRDLEKRLQGIRGEKEAFAENNVLVEERNRNLNKGLEDLINEYKALPTEYTVQDGDALADISARDDIYADKTKWKRIYHENRDKIRSPNLIYPNWVLKIPRDWPDKITVRRGDSLWKIAGYWWVFDQPTDWVMLYAKNKDTLRAKNNPDLIYPDEELVIPRGEDARNAMKAKSKDDLRSYWQSK